MSNKDLKITKTTVARIIIEGADRLDPITVFLEDIAPKNGKITVTCFGESWSAHWGGMWDGLTVAQFFTKLNAQYIIGYFSPQLRGGCYSADKTAEAATREVLKLRRENEFDFAEARQAYEDSKSIIHAESIERLHQSHNKLLTTIWGPDWWHCTEEEPNPKYQYLTRIVDAVQLALKICEPTTKEVE